MHNFLGILVLPFFPVVVGLDYLFASFLWQPASVGDSVTAAWDSWRNCFWPRKQR